MLIAQIDGFPFNHRESIGGLLSANRTIFTTLQFAYRPKDKRHFQCMTVVNKGSDLGSRNPMRVGITYKHSIRLRVSERVFPTIDMEIQTLFTHTEWEGAILLASSSTWITRGQSWWMLHCFTHQVLVPVLLEVIEAGEEVTSLLTDTTTGYSHKVWVASVSLFEMRRRKSASSCARNTGSRGAKNLLVKSGSRPGL